MQLDRALFLALTATLAAGSAACAKDTTASASDDIVQEGGGPVAEGGACFSNVDESIAPYAEGTCSAFADRMQDLEYIAMTTPSAEGTTLAGAMGCTPWSPSHPAAEGAKLCNMWTSDWAYGRCHVYAREFKRENAEHAMKCLASIEALPHSGPIFDCGFEALDRSCGYHPTAEASCKIIEDARTAKGETWNAEQRDECMTRLSGLRWTARDQIEKAARGPEPWYGITSAIEGLEPTF